MKNKNEEEHKYQLRVEVESERKVEQQLYVQVMKEDDESIIDLVVVDHCCEIGLPGQTQGLFLQVMCRATNQPNTQQYNPNTLEQYNPNTQQYHQDNRVDNMVVPQLLHRFHLTLASLEPAPTSQNVFIPAFSLTLTFKFALKIIHLVKQSITQASFQAFQKQYNMFQNNHYQNQQQQQVCDDSILQQQQLLLQQNQQQSQQNSLQSQQDNQQQNKIDYENKESEYEQLYFNSQQVVFKLKEQLRTIELDLESIQKWCKQTHNSQNDQQLPMTKNYDIYSTFQQVLEINRNIIVDKNETEVDKNETEVYKNEKEQNIYNRQQPAASATSSFSLQQQLQIFHTKNKSHQSNSIQFQEHQPIQQKVSLSPINPKNQENKQSQKEQQTNNIEEIYEIIDEINNSQIVFENQNDSVIFTQQMQNQIDKYIQIQMQEKENNKRHYNQKEQQNKQKMIKKLQEKYNLSQSKKRKEEKSKEDKEVEGKEKKLLVKVMNGKAVIRVGGGFMSVQDYIQQQVATKTHTHKTNKQSLNNKTLKQPPIDQPNKQPPIDQQQQYLLQSCHLQTHALPIHPPLLQSISSNNHNNRRSNIVYSKLNSHNNSRKNSQENIKTISNTNKQQYMTFGQFQKIR